ncbi:MAG: serine protease [Rhodospirillales bacterium CG15_BIG_FIL_POST_REV_8_21_14_020_66_15]|nr:MAG: serine protease [Rhodospirillales bacterium CG15_BIG_FIL_POST_REV_8_21_14_020_66_15]
MMKEIRLTRQDAPIAVPDDRSPLRIAGISALITAAALAAFVFMTAAAHARTAPESFADLAEKLLPSVVNISTTQVIESRGFEMPQLPPGSPFEDFFKEFFDRGQPNGKPQARKATSLGSGFIMDDDGHVVTNNHVIQDADEIEVILQDDTRLKAEVVGRDQKTDIAVLKVNLKGQKYHAISFGDSEKARVGDWVVAIGNPFGLGGTVTSGIISARGRDISAGPYDNFIQTDASINRGNSGGPLFNLQGQVIGINTAIFSPSGGSVGIGFAVPTSTARPVIAQLIKHGQVKRGWLGVHIQQVTPEVAESLGLKEPTGALVAQVVDEGPAANGKIQRGDVILKFNNRKVHDMRKLPRIVADTEVGVDVPVEVWRDNKKIDLTVKVGELKEQAPQVAARSDKGAGGDAKPKVLDDLGLTVSAITAEAAQKFKFDADAKGVLVTDVLGSGPAAEKGVRPGDLIVEVGQEEVASPDDVARKVKEARDAGRKSVLLLVQGQNGLRFVAIRLGKS